ncbi:hypothetical protein MADA3029_240031 [Vibrio nigripulchritudo MADA3029]|nr:hypothetical protein VIBNIMADA3020_370030 [Vibrio nigripulchritudo MADA3020]CCN53596.1 hypothetical protein VIBNIMADA3021_340008 [Vibrio nigripulchritudo MADA3021]CCN58712.1 hypothetical protein MADA3029_240031 [Vibrio nigripulchritudo MADA3029]
MRFYSPLLIKNYSGEEADIAGSEKVKYASDEMIREFPCL